MGQDFMPCEPGRSGKTYVKLYTLYFKIFNYFSWSLEDPETFLLT